MSAAAPVEEQSGHTLRTPKISYGGQAVLEGVMMRGRTFMAVAVRAPDKSIVVTAAPLPKHLYGGLIRLGLLVGYVALIGLMPDVKRVYGYHGAEHMTIHAWEHNDPLDPAHVAKYPPAHPRCGTAFLLEVVAISVVLFALLGTPDLWLQVLSRILLIPVIAGIAYELLRLGGKYPESVLMKAIVAPGLLLQALTTRYPDESQMEVAIASMEELLKREGDLPQPSVASSAA